jgi:hypothetical protein
VRGDIDTGSIEGKGIAVGHGAQATHVSMRPIMALAHFCCTDRRCMGDCSQKRSLLKVATCRIPITLHGTE